MKATIRDLRKFNAVQHFAYCINVDHLRKAEPWGKHLTEHFLEKLTGLVDREGAGYIKIGTVFNWMQEMSPINQHALLGYIYKHHMDKYNSQLKNAKLI